MRVRAWILVFLPLLNACCAGDATMPQEYTREMQVVGQTPIGGNVILSDDMEGLMSWIGFVTGTEVVLQDFGMAYHGLASLLLQTRLGAAIGDSVVARRQIHLGVSKSLVFDCRFWYSAPDPINFIRWEITYYDGTNSHLVRIELVPFGGVGVWTWRLWRRDAGGAFSSVDLSDVPVVYNQAWHRLRFKVNFATSKYEWIQADSGRQDVSSNIMFVSPNATPEYLQLQISAYTRQAAQITVRIDDLLILET